MDRAKPGLKDTNPKDAAGSKKAGMSFMPSGPLLEASVAFVEGHIKYRRHNYRVAGIRASVYYDAAMRHMMAYWEGEDLNPDTGMPHLSSALACLIILRDAQMNGMCNDDRPPRMEEGWLARLNDAVAETINRVTVEGAEPSVPYTQIGEEERTRLELERILEMIEDEGQKVDWKFPWPEVHPATEAIQEMQAKAAKAVVDATHQKTNKLLLGFPE